MVKQLGIPTWFLTFLCTHPNWKELLYNITKLNNLHKIKKTAYQENNKPYLMVHWEK